MRAREPDRSGYAVRDGVRLYYEVFGDGPTTVLLLPAWAIVHSRMWKMQVPYLARHFRVVTYDPRGNGRSDRPQAADAHADTELVADAVGLSMGAGVLLRLAADFPQRVRGAVFVGPAVPLAPPAADRSALSFEDALDSDVGWAKYNAHYWRRDLRGFAEFFFEQTFVEAHSSKQAEDAVGWAGQVDAETLIATARAPYLTGTEAAELAARVTCRSLVVHGDQDRIVGRSAGPALAAALGCDLEMFEGGGHCVQARHPVRFNHVLRGFVESVSA